MKKLFELLNSLFDTKAKRFILLMFIGVTIVSIIIDNIVIGSQSFLEQILGTIGWGGGTLFFGILLLNAKQLYGYKRWQLTILGLLYIFGGLLFIGLFILDLILILLGNSGLHIN